MDRQIELIDTERERKRERKRERRGNREITKKERE